MARMWGIGAYWGKDKTEAFTGGGFAAIGWDSNEAPALYEMFSRIEPGDIIYIKSKPPGRTLFIKAVGIAQDKPDGRKIKVKWAIKNIMHEHPIIDYEGRYEVYNLTLYEEMNPTIRWEVKELLDAATKTGKGMRGKECDFDTKNGEKA